MNKEKQIEEMAVHNLVAFLWHNTNMYDEDLIFDVAEALVNEGYRKQSEADNVAIHPSSAFECSECHWADWDLGTADSTYNYCPNCGAKMKGGAE